MLRKRVLVPDDLIGETLDDRIGERLETRKVGIDELLGGVDELRGGVFVFAVPRMLPMEAWK
jgi:hypothetical protein